MGVEKASFHTLVNPEYRGKTRQVRTNMVSSSHEYGVKFRSELLKIGSFESRAHKSFCPIWMMLLICKLIVEVKSSVFILRN